MVDCFKGRTQYLLMKALNPASEPLRMSEDGTNAPQAVEEGSNEDVQQDDGREAAGTSADESGSGDSDSWTSDDEDDDNSDDNDDADSEPKTTVPKEALAVSVPKLILDCGSMPTDVQFSRTAENIFATADMDGRVKIWKIASETATLVSDLTPHRSSCRALRFTKSGNLVTVGKDKRICVLDGQHASVTQTFKKAHDASIFCVLPFGEHGVVSGDDDGCIKVWDLRSNSAAMEFHENNEYISALTCDEEEKTLLATSGDGTLSAFNLRRKQLELQSEAFSSELLSVAVIKGGSKVVCGTGDGGLLVFRWGEWGYTLDQYPGREPMSIDAIEVLSPDRIYTASSDGYIRLVNMMPYRMLEYAGYHSMPFERISLSPGQDLMASTSHDSLLRFWDVSRFSVIPETTSDGSHDEDDSDDDEKDSKPDRRGGGGGKRKNNSARMPKRAKATGNDFFSDL